MLYEFRIYVGNYVSEVHIFEGRSGSSICKKVSNTYTKELGIYVNDSK
jgi:hypothetical protein